MRVAKKSNNKKSYKKVTVQPGCGFGAEGLFAVSERNR
jgi:hypothetical protein